MNPVGRLAANNRFALQAIQTAGGVVGLINAEALTIERMVFMKKLLSFILVLMLAVLPIVAMAAATEASEEPPKVSEEDVGAVAPDSNEPFTVTATYSWNTTNGSSYVLLIVQNNGTETVDLSGRVIFKNKGSIIGVKNTSETAIGSGCETILVFNNDVEIDEFEYDISTESTSSYYTSILQNLETDVITTQSKAIITIKNTGDVAAHSVDAYVLYMYKGKVADFDWVYFSEIQSGRTEMKESKTRQDFDEALVFFTGYGRK